MRGAGWKGRGRRRGAGWKGRGKGAPCRTQVRPSIFSGQGHLEGKEGMVRKEGREGGGYEEEDSRFGQFSTVSLGTHTRAMTLFVTNRTFKKGNKLKFVD